MNIKTLVKKQQQLEKTKETLLEEFLKQNQKYKVGFSFKENNRKKTIWEISSAEVDVDEDLGEAFIYYYCLGAYKGGRLKWHSFRQDKVDNSIHIKTE